MGRAASVLAGNCRVMTVGHAVAGDGSREARGCQPLTGRSTTSTLFPGEQPLAGKRPVSPANGSPWGRVTNAEPGQVPVESQGLFFGFRTAS